MGEQRARCASFTEHSGVRFPSMARSGNSGVGGVSVTYVPEAGTPMYQVLPSALHL